MKPVEAGKNRGGREVKLTVVAFTLLSGDFPRSGGG